MATRPRTSMRPVVGYVIRDRIFSSVLLPAPLRPMIPRTSPSSTEKDTSLRAQRLSVFRLRVRSCRKAFARTSRSCTRPVKLAQPILLGDVFNDDRCGHVNSVIVSDDVRETAGCVTKVHRTAHEYDRCDDERDT